MELESVGKERKKKTESEGKTEKIREAALRILDYADNSSGELARKLLQKGYPREQVDRVVRDLISAELLDDARYAGSYVRIKTEAGKGPAWIRAKLLDKGLDRGLVEQALAEVSERSSERRLCLNRALELCGLRYDFEMDTRGSLFPVEGSPYESEKAKVFERHVKNEGNRVNIYRDREKEKAKMIRRLASAGFSSDAALYAVRMIENL